MVLRNCTAFPMTDRDRDELRAIALVAGGEHGARGAGLAAPTPSASCSTWPVNPEFLAERAGIVPSSR